MNQIVEIRTYNLKPDTRARLHEIFIAKCLPLLKKWKIEVLSYGPSMHDENTYFLVRSYKDLKERQKSQDDFYDSKEWKQGPREAVIDCIESFTSLVVQADERILESFRNL